MLLRQVGSLLRGNATPFQIVAACVLGALLGFAPPSLLQAPALYALLVAAILVVNANIGLALLVGGVARIVSLLAVPVSFRVGRVLLDGPAEGLARAVANAPVLAWCGLSYYAVAGGLVLGVGFGLLIGLGVAGVVRGFRRKMAAAAAASAGKDPGRWQAVADKPWARFLAWLLIGGTGKESWEQKLAKRGGNPIRIWGAALIVLGLVGFWVAHEKLAGPLARRGIRSGLQGVNGATVDVGPVELDLVEQRFAVTDLALADRNDLARDLFRAAKLEIDVDQTDFLRRRFHVKRVVVSESAAGALRATPGELTGPTLAEAAEGVALELPNLEDLSLEDVMAEYETWKARLAQARGWLDRLSGAPEEGADGEESLTERLERVAREQGWYAAEAGHLVDEAPTFRLSELVVDGLAVDWLPGRTFDLRGTELSTHPRLVDAPPRLELASRDGTIAFAVDLAPVSRAGGSGALKILWKGLSVDTAMAQLRLPGGAPLAGGTLDLELDGGWANGKIGQLDLPLRVTLHDTMLTLGGSKPTHLDELVLPIGIHGAIDAPRIRFDHSVFADALVAAGKRELAGKVREKLGEQLGELGEKLGDDVKLPEGLDEKLGEDAGKLLDGILGGKKKP